MSSRFTPASIDNLLSHFEYHFKTALTMAEEMKKCVMDVEGDSDIHRKLQMYTIPNLTHWLNGAQAGNIKDLKETLARRILSIDNTLTNSYQGAGHEVLTKPSIE